MENIIADTKRVLITGITGYIGGRLLKELKKTDLTLRCLVRNSNYIKNKIDDDIEVVQGDVFNPKSLEEALMDIDTAFYNIHSLGGDKDFKIQDRLAAQNFINAAVKCNVKKIIYLGGLGRGANLSKHLESRQEVGKILGSSSIPLIELRASIIIGSGSLSFEMVRSLVEKLPIMTTPKWVRTAAQPISIEDVIQYLARSVDYEANGHEIFEIGGADQISYEQIMKTYAELRGLKRLIIHLPFLTPGLSSHWLNLVTPLYYKVGRWLIDGVRNETLIENNRAALTFHIKPKGIKESIERAIKNEDNEIAETHWSDAHGKDHKPAYNSSRQVGSRFIYSQSILVEAPPETTFLPIQYIGGHKGWYSYQWLWDLRAFIDKIIGGYGKSRGRRNSQILMVGDVVDFWRVEEIQMYELLRLKAEMKMPGRGWLQFELNRQYRDSGQDYSDLSVHAIFEALGVTGRLYWYILYPFHKLIFTRMLRVIRSFAVD